MWPCIVSMLLSKDVNRNHICRFVFYYAVYLHSARVPARYFLPKRSVSHDKEIFGSPCLILLRQKHLLPGYCDSSEAFSLLPLLFFFGFLLFFVEIFLRLQNFCFFPLMVTYCYYLLCISLSVDSWYNFRRYSTFFHWYTRSCFWSFACQFLWSFSGYYKGSYHFLHRRAYSLFDRYLRYIFSFSSAHNSTVLCRLTVNFFLGTDNFLHFRNQNLQQYWDKHGQLIPLSFPRKGWAWSYLLAAVQP